MLYLGIDLTDPYTKTPRPVTRAVLDESLELFFDEWVYNRVGSDMIRESEVDVVAIDGPQALAKVGATMRECERILGTPGKTKDHLPDGGLFSGYIRGSVELFMGN